MLTRDEFKALKVYLARMRGFETPEWYELFDDHFSLEPDPADHPMYGSQKLGANGTYSVTQAEVSNITLSPILFLRRSQGEMTKACRSELTLLLEPSP